MFLIFYSFRFLFKQTVGTRVLSIFMSDLIEKKALNSECSTDFTNPLNLYRLDKSEVVEDSPY